MKQLTQERKEEVEETIKDYWGYIVASFEPDTEHRADLTPNITIKRAKHFHGYTLWGERSYISEMNITQHQLTVWLNSHKLNGELKRLIIHELLHARGYNHGYIQGLKFSSHSGDKISEVVLKGIEALRENNFMKDITLTVNAKQYKQGKRVKLQGGGMACSSGLIGTRRAITIKRNFESE